MKKYIIFKLVLADHEIPKYVTRMDTNQHIGLNMVLEQNNLLQIPPYSAVHDTEEQAEKAIEEDLDPGHHIQIASISKVQQDVCRGVLNPQAVVAVS